MTSRETQRETSCNCRSVEECPHKLGDISQEEINAIVRRGMKALKCHVVRGECWCGKTHTPAAPETPPAQCEHKNHSGHPADQDIRMCEARECGARSVDGGATWIPLAEYRAKYCRQLAVTPRKEEA